MRMFRTMERGDLAVAGLGVRVLLLSAEGEDGPAAGRFGKWFVINGLVFGN